MTDVAANAPMINVQRIFQKGQSFELPQGAQVFLEQTPPALDLNIAVSNAVLAEGIYEVAVRATLTAKVNDKAVFLVEVEQACICEIRNVPDAELPMFLEIQAPSMLTPYIRATISDMLSRGTLPTFILPELNWPEMRNQRIQAQSQQVIH